MQCRALVYVETNCWVPQKAGFPSPPERLPVSEDCLYSVELCMDGKIILKLILKEYGVKILTE
jgi:hypothetical protein